MSDTEMRMLKEYSRMREMLRKALEEMRPLCDHCEHRAKYDSSGVCYSVCKWKRYDEAMKLIGGEP